MKTKYFHIRRSVTAKEFQVLFGVRFLITIEDTWHGITKVQVDDNRIDIYAPDHDIIGSVQYVNGTIKFIYDVETTYLIDKEKIDLVRSEIEYGIMAAIT